MESTASDNKLSNKIGLTNQARLTIRVCYFTSIFVLIFGALCYYILAIKTIIPATMYSFGVLNLINTALYRNHNKIRITYAVASALTIISTIVITLYSGGINSPIIFVLVLLVISGYASKRSLGTFYLNLSLFIIVLIYSQSIPYYSFTYNVVPEASRNIFALFSVLFSVYLIGGVFGKNLFNAYHDLKKSKTEIEKQINAKETLLREIHHRVKNNLQTVSSLLSLQSRNIEDPEMKSILKGSQNRVISMAMIHEKLYMRDDLSKIEYKSYVEDLSEYLINSLKRNDSNIKLKINIEDVKLGINTAIPLGLLINETVTNAIKYGLKDIAEGEINIELKQENKTHYLLNIGDNGIGMSENTTFKTSKTLGLKLIHNLAKQLSGTITRDDSKKGTNYIIRFQDIGNNYHSMA